jgi:hypothetical protein
MPRANLDTTLATDMAAPNYQPVILASFAFRSKTEYVWSGIGDLVWSGNTFKGIGSLGTMGPIGGGAAGVEEPGTSVTLSGIDADLLGETMADVNPFGAVSIWIGSWLNGGLHGTPYLLWQGGMGAPLIVPDVQKFRIVLALQTKMAQLSRPTCRRYTAADQRLAYPDDTGFNWVEIQNDIAERWGN